MRTIIGFAVLMFLFAAVAPLHADDAAVSDAVQAAATQLFRTYQARDTGFRRLVGISPQGDGFLRFGSSGGLQLSNAVSRDFSNLRSIQFDTSFFGPSLDARRSTARLSVNWFRRASFDASGEEWIVRDQSSVLVFDITGPRPLLVRVDGDPLFGLSGSSQTLIVDRGTVNGAPVTAPLAVQNGRLQGATAATTAIRRGLLPRPAGAPLPPK